MMEVTLQTLAKSIDDVKTTVQSVERRMNQRFDVVDRRFEAIDRRFEGVDRRLETMESSIHWVIGAQITLVVAMLGAAVGLIVKGL